MVREVQLLPEGRAAGSRRKNTIAIKIRNINHARWGVAHFHHRFHRVIHLPAPWLGKKYLIPSQGAGICGTTPPARGAWGMKYLIPSQGRWALVVPHPQPGGRHVKYFFPHWASCGPHGGLREKSPTHNFMKKKIRKYKLSFAFIEKLCR